MLRRLQASKAAKNAAASYLAFFSNAACAILSMAFAFRYLGKAEIGLWTVLNQVVGYLVWLDLGVGDGLGRKIAPALAAGDRDEASSWWTASWGMLLFQGIVILLLAVCTYPLVLAWLEIPPPLERDATWLFLGTSLLLAVNLPSRMYPGILLAQERFHWVPLVQSVVPWVQIAVFACMLRAGCGVRSFLWSVAAGQLTAFAAFLILVHCGTAENSKLHRTRLHWGRIRELLGFGGSLTIHGLSNAITASLPALIIGRHGGLAAVPTFGFTQRGPAMASSLVLKTSLSFYPALQRMQVEGRQQEFLSKYRCVLDLTLSVGLVGAGAIIALNRALIETIASPSFFAGHWTNLWFAAGLILGPLSACLTHLLQYSGSMGKTAWLSILQVFLYAGCGSLTWQRFGLPGMAALLVLVPLVTTAPYALVRGAKSCGFHASVLLIPVIGRAAAMAASILTCGFVLHSGASPGQEVIAFNRHWPLPGATELFCGCTLTAVGLLLFARSFKNLKNGVPSSSNQPPVSIP